MVDVSDCFKPQRDKSYRKSPNQPNALPEVPESTGVLQPSSAIDGRSSRCEAWLAHQEKITAYSYITSSFRDTWLQALARTLQAIKCRPLQDVQGTHSLCMPVVCNVCIPALHLLGQERNDELWDAPPLPKLTQKLNAMLGCFC